MGLSASEQAAIEQRLADDRHATAARIVALERDFDEIVSSADLSPTDDEHDPDGSTIAYERAKTSALLAEGRQSLVDVDTAIARLDEGSYGICEVCGQTIAHERLLARPTARACVACAAAQDHRPQRR